MVRSFIKYIALIAIVVGFASCSSSRKAVKTPMIGDLTGTAYMEKVIELSPEWKAVSGKVGLNLSLDGSKNMKVNATFRLKRDESIQFSIAPILGIEVARLEVSPDGLLALDRMNKRYVKVSFDELSKMAHTDLSYNIIQSLFLNEIFLPNKKQLSASDADAFNVTLKDAQAMLEVKASKILSYCFYTTVNEGLLQESTIAIDGTPYQLNWKYSDFNKLNTRQFPNQMQLNVKGTGKQMLLGMKFSRLSVNGDWDARTEIPSRYERIEIKDLVKMLVKHGENN
ncbi:DUF4292 domain-containing protein [uncultured Bacteroides sp.]|uniref:DUF4292 domain-containing protein n=1 Tax=uncultured Bacteroides sp. TaxID=162156 RepID=UPI0026074898|nr:DUF4292 domain-containing protein [uncultured Bacteroides sp.]